jgi:hypothetical protein
MLGAIAAAFTAVVTGSLLAALLVYASVGSIATILIATYVTITED